MIQICHSVPRTPSLNPPSMGCGASRPGEASATGAPNRLSKPVTVPPRWAHPTLMSQPELDKLRNDFWESRVDNDPTMWENIKAASEALQNADVALANAILEASNITTPSGSLAQCFDERGKEYVDVTFLLSVTTRACCAWCYFCIVGQWSMLMLLCRVRAVGATVYDLQIRDSALLLLGTDQHGRTHTCRRGGGIGSGRDRGCGVGWRGRGRWRASPSSAARCGRRAGGERLHSHGE